VTCRSVSSTTSADGRQLRILVTVGRDHRGRSASEIAELAGLAESAVIELATLLTEWRLLEQTPDGRYRHGLAPRLAAVGSAGERGGALAAAVGAANGPVRLGVGHPTGVGFVEMRPPATGVGPGQWAVGTVPAEGSALGHALLAFPAGDVAVTGTAGDLASAYEVTRLTGVAIVRYDNVGQTVGIAAPLLRRDGSAAAAVEVLLPALPVDLEPALEVLRTASSAIVPALA
jgi:DNA-binding IclR family transcriptional regulator